MKKLILLFLFTLNACQNQDNPTSKALSQNAVILAFGDSLTYGSGASAGNNYPAILSQLSGMQVINKGIPGETSGQGKHRLPALLDNYKPELLLLIHGGNDFLKKLPKEQTQGNLAEMIDAAHARQIQVIMLGVPEPSSLFMQSADLYARLAEEKRIPIDLEILPEILADNALKADLAHPNNQGYKKIAERLYELMQQMRMI